MESTTVKPNVDAGENVKKMYESANLQQSKFGKIMQFYPILFGILFVGALAFIIYTGIQMNIRQRQAEEDFKKAEQEMQERIKENEKEFNDIRDSIMQRNEDINDQINRIRGTVFPTL